MVPTIKELLSARAAEMAAQGGVCVGAAQVYGAANHLQAELLAARDFLLAHPIKPDIRPVDEPVSPAPEDPATPPVISSDDPATEDAA